jgi:hypothetical protein
MTYEQIKKNYDRKLWNDIMVSKAVNKVITPEQYFEITGKTYTAIIEPSNSTEVEEFKSK